MKRVLKYALAFALVLPMANCSRDEAPEVVNGKDGVNGKGILSGAGAPAVSVGSVGDFYLDTNTQNLYGPKTSNGWGAPVSLKGANGADGSKIYSGTATPDASVGKEGDWYIDTQNKMLYGPKTANGWGTGLALGGGSNTLKGDYVLSRDGKTLYQWLNKDATSIDMQADAELRNVEIIGKSAFNAGDLTNIVLPNNLKSIGDSAFRANKLSAVIIPNGVTKIGNGAFAENKLTSINIPNSVRSIGKGSFRNNELTSVTLSNGITTIEVGAFRDNKLTSISIPNNVISIGEYAFTRNELTSLVIPNGVVSIGEMAFALNQLISIKIGSGVIKIDGSAFSYHLDHQLSSVVIEAVNPPQLTTPYLFYIQFGSTYNPNPNLKIYVPAGSVNAYKNAEGWKEYADKIYPMP